MLTVENPSHSFIVLMLKEKRMFNIHIADTRCKLAMLQIQNCQIMIHDGRVTLKDFFYYLGIKKLFSKRSSVFVPDGKNIMSHQLFILDLPNPCLNHSSYAPRHWFVQLYEIASGEGSLTLLNLSAIFFWLLHIINNVVVIKPIKGTRKM